jgi:hypothetical protein
MAIRTPARLAVLATTAAFAACSSRPEGKPHQNAAPVLQAIGARSCVAAAPCSFTISATDAEGDVLTGSAAPLPPGATFDAASLSFSWTPDVTAAGSYDVTFSVSDGHSTASEKVTITVTPPNGLWDTMVWDTDLWN